MTLDPKKTEGAAILNQINSVEKIFTARLAQLRARTEIYDESLPVFIENGSKHIIPGVITQLKSILTQVGFEFCNCPEIETEF